MDMYERVQNLHCSLLGVHIVEWNAFAGDAGTPRNNNKANELLVRNGLEWRWHRFHRNTLIIQ